MSIGALLERMAPRTIWQRRIRTWKLQTGEPEAQLLPRLVSRSKSAVDIGAADGTYVAALIPLAAHVLAFEPIPAKAATLSRLFANSKLVTVHDFALSDREGQVKLRVPADHPWQSTIEAANLLEGRAEIAEILVQTRPLDALRYKNVGFIKIDVEGHELAVLAGARRTLAVERPNILIEVEERHHAGSLTSVAAFFKDLAYRGHFFIDGTLAPLDVFDWRVHQNPANLDSRNQRIGVYINNFIFVPQESKAELSI